MNIFKRFQICCFSQLNSLSKARLFLDCLEVLEDDWCYAFYRQRHIVIAAEPCVSVSEVYILLLPHPRFGDYQRFPERWPCCITLNWAGSASGTCYSCNTRICSYFNYCLSFLTTAPHIFNVSAPRACPGENIETFRASLQNEVLPLILRDAVIDNHTVALLYCGGRPSAVNFRHRSEMVWALGCEALSCWQQNRSRVIVQGWTGWATALR